MATDKRQFTLRLQDETFEQIKKIAYINKRSMAAQIEIILLHYIHDLGYDDIREYDEKMKKTPDK